MTNNADSIFRTCFCLFHDHWGNGQLVASIFCVSLYLFNFVYFGAFLLLPSQLKQWSIGYVDDWGGDRDQCWFYFPISKYLVNDNRGDGQLWPIMPILFFAPLSASSMSTKAMVSLLLWFFASLSAYSILCILEPFYFFRDSWGSGQLVSSTFYLPLHLFWSFRLVLRLYLLMIISCDVNTT